MLCQWQRAKRSYELCEGRAGRQRWRRRGEGESDLCVNETRRLVLVKDEECEVPSLKKRSAWPADGVSPGLLGMTLEVEVLLG